MAGGSGRGRRVAVAGAALVSLLTAGACGGGGDDKTTKARSPAQDRSTAENVNLRHGDFPKDWTAAPHQASADTDSLRQFLVCLGIPDPATRFRTDVHSPDFSKGPTTSASSEVLIASTDTDASNDLAAFQSDKGPDCFKQTIEKLLPARLPAGTTASPVTARQLEFPTLKDGTAAYQATLTLSAGGGVNIPVYVDLIVFRAGRVEAALNTLNTGSPFDTKLEQDLAKKMSERS